MYHAMPLDIAAAGILLQRSSNVMFSFVERILAIIPDAPISGTSQPPSKKA
jgi:hypothetical protein